MCVKPNIGIKGGGGVEGVCGGVNSVNGNPGPKGSEKFAFCTTASHSQSVSVTNLKQERHRPPSAKPRLLQNVIIIVMDYRE